MTWQVRPVAPPIFLLSADIENNNNKTSAIVIKLALL